jgi:hypothetical protein
MKLNRIIVSLVVGLGFVVVVGMLTGSSVQAHHAFSAEFDANRPIKVKGTIARVDWISPHSWIHLDVKDKDGKVERWMFELSNPSAMTRRGIKRGSPELKPGTEITAEGFLSKGQPRRANGRVLQYSNGQLMFVGSSGTGAPQSEAEKTSGVDIEKER